MNFPSAGRRRMNRGSVSESIRVLLVDDEKLFLETTSRALASRGCDVVCASSAPQAMEHLESRFFDTLVLDIRMPGMDGLEFLRKLAHDRPTQQVVMVTGNATVPMAVEAMKLGAFDFLLKPCKIDDLMRILERAAERGRLERRNIALEGELVRTMGSGVIVGESDGIHYVHDFIQNAASSDLPALIIGESGTGKELVARSIHVQSRRAANSFVVIDGATLRDELIASELFGHEKGAFTGAVQKKAGLFEVADRGSIFFDEIGELSPVNQAALLRVIEYGTFRPVGGVREVYTDVRIIAATNKDIKRGVDEGRFRKDLFYRLNGFSLVIPPLRERRTDIPLLARYFLNRCNASAMSKVELSSQALGSLTYYDWPGNVRELLYVIERAALLAREEGEIKLLHLPEEVRGIKPSLKTEKLDFVRDRPTLAQLQDRYESEYIGYLLIEFGGNKSEVARVLSISRSVLYEKLHRLKLE